MNQKKHNLVVVNINLLMNSFVSLLYLLPKVSANNSYEKFRFSGILTCEFSPQ